MKDKLSTIQEMAQELLIKFQSPVVLLDSIISLRSILEDKKLITEVTTSSYLWQLDRYFLYEWMLGKDKPLDVYVNALQEIILHDHDEVVLQYSNFSACLFIDALEASEPFKTRILNISEGLALISKIHLLEF